MEVELEPETEIRLQKLVAVSGKPAAEYLNDAMSAYLDEISDVRTLLSSRYESILSGEVAPLDGEQFFEELLSRERHALEKSRQ
jgi:predicted DNA-binding protein